MESKDRDFNRADSAYATGGSIHPDENFSFDNDHEPIYDSFIRNVQSNDRLKAYNSFPANSLLPKSSLYALGFKFIELTNVIQCIECMFELEVLNQNCLTFVMHKHYNFDSSCSQVKHLVQSFFEPEKKFDFNDERIEKSIKNCSFISPDWFCNLLSSKEKVIKALLLDSLNKNQDDLIVEKLPNLVETCLQEHNFDSSNNPSKEVSWYLDKLRYLLNKGIDISEENLVEAIEVWLSERRITEFNPVYIASEALDLKRKQNQKIELSNLIVSVINPNLSIEVIGKFLTIKYYKYPNDIK